MVAKRQSVGQIGLLTAWYATVNIDRIFIRGPGEEIPSLAVCFEQWADHSPFSVK